MKLEICANSVESALNAQSAGADRVELCAELSVGGITPSYATIKLAKELLDIPVYVLIRPRSGDFCYSILEREIMKDDIAFCNETGCEGVVIGGLNQNRSVDESLIKMLMQEAGYMDVTFHRAFDDTPNLFESLDTLKELGIQRVLTSGGRGKTIDNINRLGELVEEADEDLIIMPGGGVRPENLTRLLETGAVEYHSSGLLPEESTTSKLLVKRMLEVLHSSTPHSFNS